ncbi:MAG: redox-regulated ATPase YchF [Acidimicrobiia bacterium]|nr:redox-regulated ATPase YchF [Acidimicrobiia bacterium]
MGVTCGIVGLPNVGKSTLFNALTAAGAVAANYPFATVEPNVGVALVPDSRLDRIAAIVQPKSVVPTTVEFTDIAGLVAGASAGEGLGNQFLGHIREVDAIAHVVRVFEDANVTHVDGAIDPVSDIETIHTELALADLGTVERAKDRHERRAKSGDADAAAAAAVAAKLAAALGAGHPARSVELSDMEAPHARELQLLTAKPLLYIANTDETTNPELLAAVRRKAEEERAEITVIDGKTESEIAELPMADRADFLEDLGLDEPGLDKVIRAAYSVLGLNTFFTAGEKEARAWTFKAGATAPQAAGQIHTDFEKGFIRAEVISYKDFVELDGEAGAKEAGKWRLEGKEYVVQEGDVIHFRFNV